MTKRPLLFLLAAALLAGAAVYLFAFAGGEEAPGRGGGPPGGFGGPRPPAVVTVAPVELGELSAGLELVGTLSAHAFAELYAETAGRIVHLAVDTGDRVRSGQLLARIEAAGERQKMEQMQAALRMAEATLADRRAALGIAETTARRTAALAAQELVSTQQLDAAEAELEAARARVELAGAQIEQARANLGAARVELARTEIRAPFDGWVGTRHLDLGAHAGANSPVLSVVDLATIETTVSLTERDAARVGVGQSATVEATGVPGRVFPGRVARVASVFDPETHTVEAEIEVDNPEGLLKPGMFATVAIELERREGALLVPREAVVEDARESFVFAVEAAPAQAGGGPGAPSGEPSFVARRVPVEVLGSEGDRVGVAGELDFGDRVITLGHEGLADGAPVVPAGTGDGGPRRRPRRASP